MTSGDPQSQAAGGNGLSYRAAGVDIDAGEALVEQIKPLARATLRPGVLGGLGGFGALFDPKAAGFADPVLVATTDGVGTKLRIAIETGIHTTVGIDLVAMCVNDLVVQGAEPLFFLDYFATGALDVAEARDGDRRHRLGLCRGRLRPGRRRDRGNARHVWRRRLRPGRASPSARRSAKPLLPRGVAPGDVVLGLASDGAAFQRVFPGAAGGRGQRPRLGRAGAVRARRDAAADPGAGADDADADLCAVAAGAASRRAAEGGGAYHRRRLARQPAARAARGLRRGAGAGLDGARRCSAGWPAPAAWRRTRCCGCSTAASAWRWWSPRTTQRRRHGCWRPQGEQVTRIGTDRGGARRGHACASRCRRGWPG